MMRPFQHADSAQKQLKDMTRIDEFPSIDECDTSCHLAWRSQPREITSMVLASDVRISRVRADPNFLFPTNSKRLTRFMMDATYGTCQPLTAAWAQRGLLDAAADSDFFERLAYYEETRDTSPRGAIFVAETSEGTLCGFADVGASLWLPNDRCFRLPQSPDLRRLAESGIGADGKSKPGVELRPYVSNVVVETAARRGGIGRQLMQACEAEAATWAASGQDIWLEVTSTNEAGLAFYSALGYETDGCTVGSEVQRMASGGFEMAEVERCVMRKALRLRAGWSQASSSTRLSRRQLGAWAVRSATALGVGMPQATQAFAPPVGNVELLVPLLRCREIVQEQREAVAVAAAAVRPGAVDWDGLQRTLLQPPITEASKAGRAATTSATTAVGSGFRAASAAYEESLIYIAEIDDADRAFCYVSKAVKVDAQCLQRLYTSDRTFRTLLRNEVLTQLQALEAEASYQARCEQAARFASSGPASPLSDGITCDAGAGGAEDAAEMLRLLDATLGSFEKLFSSVGADELRGGVERLRASATSR